ncbi:uncharacterized protein [Venturia canescens]|uniref:uncharacterized protein isoform X2 n=1 Tax=Venturia canescens TaxID=32260 RepID=UPI001C9D17ED|nr:uncharacterized protein LOC122417219 isoform X2 [Venturia canescens]
MNVATIITEILTFPKKIWERSPPWGKILIVAVGLLLIMTLSLLPIISAEKRWRSDGLTGEEIFAESWKSTVSFLDFWVKDSNGVEVKLKDVYYDDVPTLVVFAASPNLIQKNTDKTQTNEVQCPIPPFRGTQEEIVSGD